MPQMVQGHDVGAGMGHSEKLLEIAFNQRRLKAATPKLDDILFWGLSC